MEIDESKIQALIDRPRESLAVEIKNWVLLEDDHGKAKIVRAAIALRNHGGGYLLIGFNDKTLEPETHGIPSDVRGAYHADKVQKAIGKYASESFEVGVAFGMREEQEFPVLVIPPGVQSPVAAKADLIADGQKLISTDEVFVRTLRSNVPATAKASWMDWAPLMQVCLDNREADIGRFLRRQLLGNIEGLKAIVSEFGSTRDDEGGEERAIKLLDVAANRMGQISGERTVSIPDNYGYWDAALVIEPSFEGHKADNAFLQRLDSANPQLTGWPIWLVSSGMPDDMVPFVNDDAWETFIGRGRHIQYMRYDPKGTFVQRAVLADDQSRPDIEPGKVLDFAFPIQDCVEAIVVGLEFAKILRQERAVGLQVLRTLYFAFRWSGLKGRTISHWGHPRRYISHSGTAYQHAVTASVAIPEDAPVSSIGSIVIPVIRKLHAVFGGFSLDDSTIEEIVSRTVNRQRV